MRLWRISNHAGLAGDGGLYASGRWHSRERRVVYLADHPASALVEVMVHLEIDAEDLPAYYQLLGVEVPDEMTATSVAENGLPDDWRQQTAASPARSAINGCAPARPLCCACPRPSFRKPPTICSIPRIPTRRSPSRPRSARRSIRG